MNSFKKKWALLSNILTSFFKYLQCSCGRQKTNTFFFEKDARGHPLTKKLGNIFYRLRITFNFATLQKKTAKFQKRAVFPNCQFKWAISLNWRAESREQRAESRVCSRGREQGTGPLARSQDTINVTCHPYTAGSGDKLLH